jgi:hypothetical protein
MSIHSHSHRSSLPLSFTSLKTAKDYRAMAEECAKWAREARDDDVSAPLLQLGQTWLDAASKLDGLPASQVPPTSERPKVVKLPSRC